jgi:putative tryptophan/tyrosine transport system substrate-binding protein
LIYRRTALVHATYSINVVFLAITKAASLGFMAAGAFGSPNSLAHLAAIKQGLGNNGMVEGRDYVLEARFAEGHYERFPDMARELAQTGARVILTNTILSVRLRA